MNNIITDTKELTKPCEDVSSFDEAMSIADQLYKVLGTTDGIGLAANQIGINKKVFVISVPEGYVDENGKVRTSYRCMTFANPKIVKLEDPVIFSNEGCLSFPGESIETIRYDKVVIQDLLAPEGRTLQGLRAIVCQHEFDHTQSVVMHRRKKNAQGVNDPCPCNSGLKYKKCCMSKLKKASYSIVVS